MRSILEKSEKNEWILYIIHYVDFLLKNIHTYINIDFNTFKNKISIPHSGHFRIQDQIKLSPQISYKFRHHHNWILKNLITMPSDEISIKKALQFDFKDWIHTYLRCLNKWSPLASLAITFFWLRPLHFYIYWCKFTGIFFISDWNRNIVQSNDIFMPRIECLHTKMPYWVTSIIFIDILSTN